MSQDFIQFINYLPLITWPVVAFFFIWKIGVPLTRAFLKNKNKAKNGQDLEEMIEDIERNHLGEVRRDIAEMKRDIREVKIEQVEMGKKIVRVETKVFNTQK
ncbi:hypothetical protein KAR91_03715 [Candidatus Pacearchaeota archaeon]|nr:hypothetical protein [Candidatus Pacearchaeota archaeon]